MIRFLQRREKKQKQGVLDPPQHHHRSLDPAPEIDPPCEVLDADSIFSVGVRSAHFHVELGVEEQHKVDVAVVSVHVHQEGVFDHQPPTRPAEAELVVTDAVQTLDPVTS